MSHFCIHSSGDDGCVAVLTTCSILKDHKNKWKPYTCFTLTIHGSSGDDRVLTDRELWDLERSRFDPFTGSGTLHTAQHVSAKDILPTSVLKALHQGVNPHTVKILGYFGFSNVSPENKGYTGEHYYHQLQTKSSDGKVAKVSCWLYDIPEPPRPATKGLQVEMLPDDYNGSPPMTPTSLV